MTPNGSDLTSTSCKLTQGSVLNHQDDNMSILFLKITRYRKQASKYVFHIEKL